MNHDSSALTKFLNSLLDSKVKLCYKTFSTYYATLLLVDQDNHQLKIHSSHPEQCTLENFEAPLEVHGYLNAFNVITYIKSPDASTVMWRLQFVINDVSYIISMDSDPTYE